MRFFLIVALTLAAFPVAAQDAAAARPDPRAARLAYQQALKAEQQHDFAGALANLREAVDLAPGTPQYLAALARLREQVIDQYLRQGNQALSSGQPAEAIARFAAALDLDPANGFAQQRLRDAQAALPHSSSHSEDTLRIVKESGVVALAPTVASATIHFNGDSRGLLAQVAAAFGLRASFDDDFRARPVQLDLDRVSFPQALRFATMLAHAMWVARAPDEIFFVADTPEKHRQFDRMVLRTFYLRDLNTAQQLNDVANALRSLFNVRYLVVDANQSLLTVKAPQPILEAVTQFLGSLSSARPQVALDLEAWEISSNFLRQLGLTIPAQFQLLNIPPQVIQALNTGNIQQQIQQILSSGTLTQAQQQAIQALEMQLQNLQATGLASLLNQPFITFGHGHTLFAVTYPGQFAVNFGLNRSYVTNFDHATLRASQGDTATLLIGTRFPVLTSTFALPGQNTSGLGLAAFPTFNYEDLGISLKARPEVHLYSPDASSALSGPERAPEVTLDLDLAIKSLTGQSFNGVPVISNREYKGMVRLREGEPAVLVGSITRDQERSLSGIPGLGLLPVVGRLFSTSNVNNSEDELMIIVTPHIVRLPGSLSSPTIAVPALE